MAGKTRKGKVVTAGHSTRVKGLMEFLQEIGDAIPEIESLRIGAISPKGGNLAKGGLSMRVTRYYQVGTVRTGLMCVAGKGGLRQEVVIVAKGEVLPQIVTRLKHTPGVCVSEKI